MVANCLRRITAFRRRKRDAGSDLQRSETVWSALTDAIASLDAEKASLRRRVEGLRDWVGGLMGPEDCSSCRREDPVETELRDAELQLMSGLKRLAHLDHLRAAYQEMREAIEAEGNRASTAYRPAAWRIG